MGGAAPSESWEKYGSALTQWPAELPLEARSFWLSLGHSTGQYVPPSEIVGNLTSQGTSSMGQPHLDVPIYSPWPSLREFPSQTTYTVRLKRGTDVKKTQTVTTDASGFAWVYVGSEVVMPGDVLEVQGPTSTFSVAVPSMSIEFDLARNVLKGYAPASQPVSLWARDWSTNITYWDAMSTAADGYFEWELTGDFTAKPGDYGQVRYTNPAGHLFWIGCHPPTVYVRAGTVEVRGHAGRGVPVTITLYRDGAAIAAKTVQSELEIGGFSADMGQKIEPRDWVRVSAPGQSSVSVYVVRLTCTIDSKGERIWGSAPAGSRLRIEIEGWGTTFVNTNEQGIYLLDLHQAGNVIQPGRWIEVYYSDAAEHKVYLRQIVPQITVDSYSSVVWGYVSPAGHLTIRHKRAGTVLGSREMDTNADGYFWTYSVNSSSSFLPGDEIEVARAAGTPIVIPIVDLRVYVNLFGQRITGTAPPNTYIELNLQKSGCGYNNMRTTSASDGTYTFDFMGKCSLVPQDYGWVLAWNQDDNRVTTYLHAPYMNIMPARGRVEGYVGTVAPYTVTLRHEGSVTASITGTASGSGWFSQSVANLISEGDTVELIAPLVWETVTVPQMTARADADLDVISGKGPSNGLIRLQFYSSQQGRQIDMQTNAGASGDYQFDLSGQHDLVAGNSGTVWHDLASGHRVSAYWSVTRLEVWVHGTSVRGGGAPGKSTVTVTLWRGGVAHATAQTTAYEYGNWYATLPAVIQPGDEVEAAMQDGTTVRVTVVDVTATIDWVARRVSGTAPQNANLGVELNENLLGRWLNKVLQTAANGAYSADFSADIAAIYSAYAYARYTTPSGHQIYAQAHTPNVDVRMGTGGISGYLEPLATATIRARRAGTELFVRPVQADSAGYFSVSAPVALVSGDEITLAQTGKPDRTFTLVSLTGRINVANDTVTGTGPANTTLIVKAGKDYWQRYIKIVQTNASGAFTADYAGTVDFGTGATGMVTYYDAALNGTVVPVGVPSVRINMTDRYLSGTLAPGMAYTFTVKSALGEVKGTYSVNSYSYDGGFSLSIGDGPCSASLEGGDRVEIAAGPDLVTTVPVTRLTATASTTADLIWGMGPPNSPVTVTVSGLASGDHTKSVQTTATGSYQAPFSGLHDIVNGDQITVAYVSPDGSHGTSMYLYLPNRIYINPGARYVSVATSAYSPVSITVKQPNGAVRETAVVTASYTGSAYGYFNIMLPGDRVEVQAGGRTTTMIVPVLRGTAERRENRVCGTGPANSEIIVTANYGQTSQKLTTDAAGYFSTTLPTPSGGSDPVQGGTNVTARYIDSAGNSAQISWNAPRISIDVARSTVGGYADPSRMSLLTLRGSDGTPKAVKRIYPNYYGSFSGGADVVPVAGDVVELMTAGQTYTMTVPPLAISADIVSNTIVVTGPPSSRVYVSAYHYVNFQGDTSFSQYVTTGTDGKATPQIGAMQLRALDQLGVSMYSEENDYAYTSLRLPGLVVNETQDSVSGYGSPGIPVNLTLRSNAGDVKATAVATPTVAGSPGTSQFRDGAGVLISIDPGDTVEATGGAEASVSIPLITATVDPATDEITGQGPPSTWLYLVAYSRGWGRSQHTFIGATGNFKAAFSCAQSPSYGGLQQGDDASIYFKDTVGHIVVVQAHSTDRATISIDVAYPTAAVQWRHPLTITWTITGALSYVYAPLYWDTESHAMAEGYKQSVGAWWYRDEPGMLTTWSYRLTAPAGAQNLYFRLRATVDGHVIETDEMSIPLEAWPVGEHKVIYLPFVFKEIAGSTGCGP